MNLIRVGVVAAVASVAVIVATAVAVYAGQGGEAPAGTTSHSPSEHAESVTSYWTSERMRDAEPQPFPAAPVPGPVDQPSVTPQKPSPAGPPK
jgi:hypothetical protein